MQGASIRYEVIRGREPSDAGPEYSQEIPRTIFKQCEVEKKDGRGNILVVGKPSIQNEVNLKLRFIDRKGGDDRYHARIKWERERLLPPTSPKPQTVLTAAPVVEDRAVLAAAPAPTPQDPAGIQVYSKDNAPGLCKSLELEKKDGRGEVLLQERPWEGNDHTGVIQISDPKGGEDRYHFKFKWKR